MKIINVDNKEVLVDDEDYQWLVDLYGWHLNTKGYVQLVKGKKINGKWVKKTWLMSRLIMLPPHGMVVDHINRNPLDNRRCNLRVCTTAENVRNRRKNSNSFHSKFKGVTLIRRGIYTYWYSSITLNRKNIFLGSFKDEVLAARAYDEAAKKLHGEFAKLNFAIDEV